MPDSNSKQPRPDISAFLQRHAHTLRYLKQQRDGAENEKLRALEALRQEWQDENEPLYQDFPELFNRHCASASRRIANALGL